MTWLLGVDLRPHAEGAVAFASWLARAQQDDRVVPVHVLVADHLQAVLQHRHLAEVKDAAKVDVGGVLSRHDLEHRFAPPLLVEGGTAEGRLELVRKEHKCHAVVLNRFATDNRRRLRRLGRVARRTLRALDCPVVTVPPGFKADAAGQGPVLMTTNLTEDCKAALDFAADVAKRTGRPLVVVTVRRLVDQQVAHTRLADATEALSKWLKPTAHQPDEQIALLGEVVTNVSEYARERNACMIVAGARRLSKIERFFLTSVGRGLSATAPAPVAVVPPAHT